jgi:hypothetical protein
VGIDILERRLLVFVAGLRALTHVARARKIINPLGLGEMVSYCAWRVYWKAARID